MLPFRRPKSHGQHAAEAQRLLGAVRAEVEANEGRATKEHFDRRAMWTSSWQTPSKQWDAQHGDRTAGIYKRALVGLDRLHVRSRCAWCEQTLEWKALDVDHFRPKCEVSEWEGLPSETAEVRKKVACCGDGYWWLAFSWENWLLSCAQCNTEKGSFFPRIGPLPEHRPGLEAHDNALLIDPSSEFVTRDHFRWDDQGYVFGTSARGTATIIACALNRKTLQNARAKTLRDARESLDDYCESFQGSQEDIARAGVRLQRFAAADAEFSSMVRWHIEERLRVVYSEPRLCWEDLALSEG